MLADVSAEAELFHGDIRTGGRGELLIAATHYPMPGKSAVRGLPHRPPPLFFAAETLRPIGFQKTRQR
jgi:hypothetical protein